MEYSPHVETIQVVMDSELRVAADQAARRFRVNRSQLVRDALREHLKRLEIKAREDLDRKGYATTPTEIGETQAWEREAAWPEV